MDIDFSVLCNDPLFAATKAAAHGAGLTKVKIRRWKRRRGATFHIIFHEPGVTETWTYKFTVSIKRKRRADHG